MSRLGEAWSHYAHQTRNRYPDAVEYTTVRAGRLATPADWISNAPHLIRAVLNNPARCPGIPRNQGLIAAAQAVQDARLKEREKLWTAIRGGFNRYDPATLRDEAVKVGLITTFGQRPRRGAEPEPAPQDTETRAFPWTEHEPIQLPLFPGN